MSANAMLCPRSGRTSTLASLRLLTLPHQETTIKVLIPNLPLSFSSSGYFSVVLPHSFCLACLVLGSLNSKIPFQWNCLLICWPQQIWTIRQFISIFYNSVSTQEWDSQHVSQSWVTKQPGSNCEVLIQILSFAGLKTGHVRGTKDHV